MLAPLVGALAAGNAAVLKPSELAPRHLRGGCAFSLPDYLDAAAVAVMEGGVPETEEILGIRFDSIFFTGSGTVGKIVMKKAAEHLTPVTLELGGKSPTLVLADADIPVAARRIAWGKFMNAGQTCIAPDYVLVEESVEGKLTAAIKQSIRDFYGENPQRSPDYCRIVNSRNYDRLVALLKDGQIEHGGECDARERYIAPTLLRGVTARKCR